MDLRRFLSDPTKSCVNIVEWLLLKANVLDFRYVFALLTVRDLAQKLQILGFTPPVRYSIAKVLLMTKEVSVRAAAAEILLPKSGSAADFKQRSILTVRCRQL